MICPFVTIFSVSKKYDSLSYVGKVLVFLVTSRKKSSFCLALLLKEYFEAVI